MAGAHNEPDADHPLTRHWREVTTLIFLAAIHVTGLRQGSFGQIHLVSVGSAGDSPAASLDIIMANGFTTGPSSMTSTSSAHLTAPR